MAMTFDLRLRAAGLAALLATTATAVPTDSKGPLVAIHAGRLVDVDQGMVLQDRWLIVRGDRIESILPGSATAPAGARVIDLSSSTAKVAFVMKDPGG